MPRLSERAFIHEIEALASRWRDDHGKAPVNVSHWNPSDEFLGRLQRHLAPSLFDPLAHVQACDPVPYRYSQGLPIRAAMLAKLGFSSDRVYALITENGTSSISTVANWLKLMGVAEVVLLAPYYYATLHSLRRLGIAVRQVPLERTADGAYRLPALAELDLRPRDALWITNPVYSTGLYALEQSCDALRQLAQAGVLVVADESLALRPTAIARSLDGHENFAGIYTPHKSICMNGIKFSAVVVHPRHQTTLEDWADVLSGGLSVSAIVAIQHFITPSFDERRAGCCQLLRKTRDWHIDLVGSFGGAIALDAESEGHFVMAYVAGLAAEFGNRIDFLKEILEETGCILVPGFRSGFDERSGFCFRINLARDSDEFRSGLKKLYSFLRSKK